MPQAPMSLGAKPFTANVNYHGAQSNVGGFLEVLADRLYCTTVEKIPEDTVSTHYFSIDKLLVYEPFCNDFGPLHLGMICRFCHMVESKLRNSSLAGKYIVHCWSKSPAKRANAALLMCAYQVIILRRTALEVHATLEHEMPVMPFRDATMGACSYECTLLDCLQALEFSIRIGWFNYWKFDIESYEFFSQVENGDMNWVIPGKFLAFAGPSPTSVDSHGYPACVPEDYVSMFSPAGIGLVVRLNKAQYEANRFTDSGIRHVDLYFRDGSCPPQSIISKFLHITEGEKGAVAVHCKAGLGRTGTLIGLYAMKHHRFPARAFIAWNRICRPGSILGPQQQFLVDMEADMFQAWAAARKPAAVPAMPRLSDQQVSEKDKRGEHLTYEDVGQGERLCDAKRNAQKANPQSPSASERCPLGFDDNASQSGQRSKGVWPEDAETTASVEDRSSSVASADSEECQLAGLEILTC